MARSTGHTASRARRRALVCCSVLCGTLFSIPVTAQKPAGFDRAWASVVEAFRADMKAGGIVGASLWFFRGSEELGREFYGVADLETQRPVDENTIWHWASITKTLTGIAVLQLRDRGHVDLDAPILDWVPELRAVHSKHGPIERVTVRHLLSHSAGFRAPTWPWGGNEAWHPHEPTEWSQLVAMLPYTELLFEPGARFSYSNPGIVFLGRMIETISGDDWEVYVDKNILRPLGMQRSYFDVTPYHLLQYRSNNYRLIEGRPVANGLDFDTGITVSNGGLNAPVPDMARYLAFLAGRPQRDVVLSRASLEAMWRPVVQVGQAPWGARESMGLTFFLYEGAGPRLIGHTGSQRAFQSFFLLDPASGAIAIATFNSDGGKTREILNGVRGRVVRELFGLFQASQREEGEGQGT